MGNPRPCGPYRSKKAGKVSKYEQIMPTFTSRAPEHDLIKGALGQKKSSSRINLRVNGYQPNISCPVGCAINCMCHNESNETCSADAASV